jgi:endonuclease/exonuclease/phosphatase family metal-dependent hydrolase
MKRFVLGAITLVVVATLVPTAPADALLTFSVGTFDGRPLCGVAPGPLATDDGALIVSTFNVLHSETDEGDISLAERLPLIADAIIASRADIIGAQEVTENVDFDAKSEYPQKHGLVAQRLAALISARSGERWSWCYSRSNPHVPLTPDLNVGGGNPLDDLAAAMGNFPEGGSFAEGVAVFSRYPILRSRFRRMLPRSYEAAGCLRPDPFCPLDATFDSRQVLWARARTPQGSVDLFTTHIAHGLTDLSPISKQLQVRQAIAIANKWAAHDPGVPDFLVGDFNSAPHSAAMRTAAAGGFYDTYRLAGSAECVTSGDGGCSGGPKAGEEVYTKTSARSMDERIDYVLARAPRGCALRVPSSDRIADSSTKRADGRFIWPSDHYAFVSTVGCA